MFLVILVSIISSSSIGYIVGTGQSRSFQSAIVALNQTKTVTDTLIQNATESALPDSIPIQANPFEYTEGFEGDTTVWYVPIVFLGRDSTSQMYVNYDCDGPCSSFNSKISSMGITASPPESFAISQNGRIVSTSDIQFSSGSIVEYENTSETVLYTLTISPSSSGYYTFSIPFGCIPEPVLYVKTSQTDYGPLDGWLGSTVASNVSCSDQVEVTILGFTNSYYTDVRLLVNSTS